MSRTWGFPCMALAQLVRSIKATSSQPESFMLEKNFWPMVGRTVPKRCSSNSHAGRTPSIPCKLPASPMLQQAAPASAYGGLALTLSF